MSDARSRGKNPAQRFQDEMKKLGLAVSIQLDDRDPVVVTAFRCPDCRVDRNYDAETENKVWQPCACGSTKEPVLT